MIANASFPSDKVDLSYAGSAPPPYVIHTHDKIIAALRIWCIEMAKDHNRYHLIDIKNKLLNNYHSERTIEDYVCADIDGTIKDICRGGVRDVLYNTNDIVLSTISPHGLKRTQRERLSASINHIISCGEFMYVEI